MSDSRQIEGIDWHGSVKPRCGSSNGRPTGSGGINRLMSDYTLTGDLLSFGAIGTTTMAGPRERMEPEQRFLAALAMVARWSTIVDDAADQRDADLAYGLVLPDDDDGELLRFPPGSKT